MSDEKYMRMAITKAHEGIGQGELPFGACMVKDGAVVSCEHNRILSDKDVTAHAEIIAIREACHKLGTIDLSGCVIYCTCEPCPMCIGAMGLANINSIVYGTRIGDVNLEGYTVLETPGDMFRIISNGQMKVIGGFLREENLRLFKEWEKGR